MKFRCHGGPIARSTRVLKKIKNYTNILCTMFTRHLHRYLAWPDCTCTDIKHYYTPGIFSREKKSAVSCCSRLKNMTCQTYLYNILFVMNNLFSTGVFNEFIGFFYIYVYALYFAFYSFEHTVVNLFSSYVPGYVQKKKCCLNLLFFKSIFVGCICVFYIFIITLLY